MTAPVKTTDQLIAEAAQRGLRQLILQESVGGWQAILKYGSRITGPWDVGCDESPELALRKALELHEAAKPEIILAGGIFD